jgi:LmbE family N-acetylglucosaminyl deacetylase
MGNDVVVIAVHPDDESLGCGGSILRHAANGDRVHWIIVTDMNPELFSREHINRREREIVGVASRYGFSSIIRFKFPTTRLFEVPETALVDAFSQVIRKISPHTIYLPFLNDIHSDHRFAFHAAMTCTKSFRYPSVKRVLMMEALSETEFAPPIGACTFMPNVYTDISDYIEQKLEILALYEEEIAPSPFPRSVETVRALASFRGAVAGCQYAEAFMLLREIQ